MLAGTTEAIHVGLRNVDVRLRQVYGDAHGLVIDTAPGAGTLITMRIPKSPRAELRAGNPWPVDCQAAWTTITDGAWNRHPQSGSICASSSIAFLRAVCAWTSLLAEMSMVSGQQDPRHPFDLGESDDFCSTAP